MPLRRESWGWVGAASTPQVEKSSAAAKTGNIMLAVRFAGVANEWIKLM